MSGPQQQWPKLACAAPTVPTVGKLILQHVCVERPSSQSMSVLRYLLCMCSDGGGTRHSCHAPARLCRDTQRLVIATNRSKDGRCGHVWLPLLHDPTAVGNTVTALAGAGSRCCSCMAVWRGPAACGSTGGSLRRGVSGSHASGTSSIQGSI
jgi:hypothetical protein